MSRYAPAARPLVRCLRASGINAATAAAPASTASTPAAAAAATSTHTLAAAASSAASPAHVFRAPFSSSARQLLTASPASSTPATTTTTTTTTTTSSTSPAAPDSRFPPPPPLEELLRLELDPDTATIPWAEKELMRRGTPPVGSRRRRAAIQAANDANVSAGNAGPIPFELLPYQCFQEARKVLKADRDDKLKQIAAETAKIRKLEEVLKATAGSADDGASTATITSRGGVAYVQKRLASLRAHVEELKILADINDPLVKRRFEDGRGDMNKPIYRYLAEQRWRGRPFRLINQRLQQFYVAPDLVAPSQLRVNADVELFFRSYRVAPGAVVDSIISEATPRLRVQVFDRGTRYVSIVAVDADVPDLESDTFKRRCHFLATNVPVSPADASVVLSRLDPAKQVALPWLPAFAQKGSPPHRLAVFVLEHNRDHGDPASLGAELDFAALQTVARDGFSVRNFINKNKLDVIGCTLFRTEWDAGTAGVMERAGIPGADLELKPTRLPSLKPPRKARGWEAKHQGPKYRHLWKYTHRIATPKRKFVR